MAALLSQEIIVANQLEGRFHGTLNQFEEENLYSTFREVMDGFLVKQQNGSFERAKPLFQQPKSLLLGY